MMTIALQASRLAVSVSGQLINYDNFRCFRVRADCSLKGQDCRDGLLLVNGTNFTKVELEMEDILNRFCMNLLLGDKAIHPSLILKFCDKSRRETEKKEFKKCSLFCRVQLIIQGELCYIFHDCLPSYSTSRQVNSSVAFHKELSQI